VSRIEAVEGVIELDDGLVFIHDLDKFLSPDETCTLDRAMNGTD
jgi:purine-binding chemotaxis protein CheW